MITLGIDTSNYTTSVAVYNGVSFEMLRQILDVGEGKRGIRQSEGVFVHNRELPCMIEKILKNKKINAIGVSTRPRNVKGSYMPVFTVGHGYARAMAAALKIPIHEFSHQDGHIMAGVYSAKRFDLLYKPFISVHISGGTTEILKSEFDGYNFVNEIIGGTLDISVGQLIDRCGVAMGLHFPCGKELEVLASKTDKTENLPFSLHGAYMNLSGVETKLMRAISGEDAKQARTILCYIRDVLSKAISSAMNETGLENVLIAGGVASNSIIRKGLQKMDVNICFASKELSSDNSVGIAILTALAQKGAIL